MTPQLELRGLVAGYGATEILHGIDLRVASGGVTALLGANGAGKTTTLRAVSGLIRPHAGDILLDGKSLLKRSASQIAALGVGHVPDGRGTISELSVEENLQTGGYLLKGRDALHSRMEQMFVWFPILKQRLRQQAGTLSGGEQQMLAIARAMIARPRLLLLDEPSFGIAPLVVRQIFDTLREINRKDGIGVLLIEQNAALALDIAGDAYVLENGRVAVHGASADLKNDAAVRRSYLGG
ncbi:ABC transporter ATP-binding protein [Variovorax sp. UMC13]|uniref:ABC transporter ATP-binding protein n=1 Tax=Variovorax sp. UMC13 TaxID=1862326 RepID=UPI0015FF2BF6|nr:ABC transporter ATP-binding protein [Variovorax sp. UMC13]MBB1600510.1 ABC transporter ATP-binding protein [Variovorax sp. UMC13]